MGTSTGRRWRAVYLLVVASLLLTACAAADRAVHGGFTDGTFPYVSFPYTPLWGPGTYQTTIDGDDDELDFRPASTSDPTIRVTSSTFWPPGIPDPIRDGKVAPDTVVKGRPAWSTGDAIYWQPDRYGWLSLTMLTGPDPARLRWYAEHMVRRPVAAAGDIVLDQLPTGARVARQSPTEVLLEGEPAGSGWIKITVYGDDRSKLPAKVLTGFHDFSDLGNPMATYTYGIPDGRYVMIWVFGRWRHDLDPAKYSAMVHPTDGWAPVPSGTA
ncbi:MAG TPA: hypothetical protein VKB69_11550 [Micromonosporaceae bacterium]|nr:hypothetical protein [Micromonosporaceae bacterium]